MDHIIPAFGLTWLAMKWPPFPLLGLLGWFVGSGVVAAAAENSAAPPRFPWPEGQRAALSLTFDDARLSQMDVGLELFARLDVKVTFYVSPAPLKQRLPAWQRAVAAGHEIGNHTMTHPCSGSFPWSRSNALEDYTLERMRREMTDANTLIREALGVDARAFAYPCGQKFIGRGHLTRTYVPLVAELFLTGRGYRDEAPNDPGYSDLAQLTAVSGDNQSFDEIRPFVDEAIARGYWLVLAGHEIGTNNVFQTTQVPMLEALVAYARQPDCNVWIDTVSAVGDYVQARRTNGSPSALPLHRDDTQPIAVRVEELLARMTLEEKVGQMNMPCVYLDELGTSVEAKLEACRKFAAGTYAPGIGPGGGFFTLANTVLPNGPTQQVKFFNELQRIALEQTRLKIPLLQTEEGTHGLMCSGATIFPEGLALGSAWNVDLIRRIYTVAAREARAVGIHQLFTLVVEPNRDPRLGRNQEGYSEDPFLCARIADAIVAAVQGDDVSAPDKVVAGLCHYPGQSQPVSGLERGAMEISERALREVFLPPWVAGIRQRGALGVMATYPAIDGVPAHASEDILTRILRQELGFDGLVLSEGSGISTLLYEGLAATPQEAGELCLRAGVDVGISYERGYMQDLVQSVHQGRTPMALVDRAVRRILKQKFQLGLFERPYADPERAIRVSHTPEHVALARQAAREGIVLLKNEKDLLPLSQSLRRIAVIGPNGDHAVNQLGDYTPKSLLHEIVTVLEGIRRRVPNAAVAYVRGCEVTGTNVNQLQEAAAAARSAEVAIVVVGENSWSAPDKQGTDGEGYDVATLELTGLQEELVRAVQRTGTPTVVVLLTGRPLALRWIADHVPAILVPWMCGEQGGAAVAEVLFGDYSPSGRLPITVPRHVGQLPVYYNAKPSKAYWLKEGWGRPYADLDPSPLYEFGHGLSYASFEYADLRIAPARIGRGGTVKVTCTVANTSSRAGQEVVQLYLRDVVSSVTTPVQQLRGFAKVALAAGEKKAVAFELGPEELALLNRQLEWVVEPGEFAVAIGASSKDIRLQGRFEVQP